MLVRRIVRTNELTGSAQGFLLPGLTFEPSFTDHVIVKSTCIFWSYTDRFYRQQTLSIIRYKEEIC